MQPRRVRFRVAGVPGVVVGSPADLSALVVVVDRAVAPACRAGPAVAVWYIRPR